MEDLIKFGACAYAMCGLALAGARWSYLGREAERHGVTLCRCLVCLVTAGIPDVLLWPFRLGELLRRY